MLNFKAIFNSTNLVDFPATKGVDSSGGTATDGTEFVANFINDIWGYFQGLLSMTGQNPNGLVEEYNNSQLILAHQRFTIPGMIIPVAWNDDPASLNIRAIMLTGQTVLVSSYPDLSNVVYCGDTNNDTASAFYRCDNPDGTGRNTIGAYLKLPDARGRVVRGLDTLGAIDPDGASRDLGSLQGSAMWGHWHTSNTGNGGAAKQNYASNIASNNQGVYSAMVQNPVDDGTHGTPTLSSESRMINIAFNYAITY